MTENIYWREIASHRAEALSARHRITQFVAEAMRF
jgi:hypothetical protein